MNGGVIMAEIRYVKPNMTNLRGRLGKSILHTLKNAPAPDLTEQKKAVREMNSRIKAAKENGTF